MKKYLLICTGGFLGAAMRYAAKSLETGDAGINIPLSTFFINVTGCFLFGLLFEAFAKLIKNHKDAGIGITTGFLGAYTTFSALCKELFQYMEIGLYWLAAIYLLLTYILGFVAMYSGIAVVRNIVKNNAISKDDIKIDNREVTE